MRSKKDSESSGYLLVVTRRFNGTPERVFDAWTYPEKISRWWGPQGFTTPVCEIDLREGGQYHFCVRSPQGVDFWTRGTFREIVAGKKIIAAESFSDVHGNIIPAAMVGLPGHWPNTLVWAANFERELLQTKLTLRHFGLPNEMVESCRAGWNESFDKLALLLS